MTTVVGPATGRQLAVATLAGLALLGVLAAGIGLGPAGWAVGLGHTLALVTLLARAARRAGVARLGPADLVTLTRAVLAVGVSALVADGLAGRPVPAPVLVALAGTALALDLVDGWVARRTATTSAPGARFDMEADAALILVLSVHAVTLLGPWTLAVGGMRYAFVLAGRVQPWLRAPLPPRYSAKVVAAAQGVVLVVVAAGVLAPPVATALVAAALAALVWSFGHDVVRLAAIARRTRPESARPARSGWRRALARAGTVLAGLLLVLALLAPADPALLTPAAFTRIPVEGLLAVAALLLLVRAPRPARLAAGLGGALLGLLTVGKLVDVGFTAALARPFRPVIDWPLFADAARFVTESAGGPGSAVAVLLAVALLIGIPVLLLLSALRVASALTRHRRSAAAGVVLLAVGWLGCAALDVEPTPGPPVAAASTTAFLTDIARRVLADLRDPGLFAAEVADDRFRDTPGPDLLTALRGKDVLVVFVESYGRDAVQRPAYAASVGEVLADGDRRLGSAGFGSRSGYLRSPTVGGASWLAHATLLAGVRVDNQQRYDALHRTDRSTLVGAFGRAGWRTVAVQPGTTTGWPQAGFYGYRRVYESADLGYRGPNFSFATMPDQFTLAAFERLERSTPDRPPLMAEIALMSSHAPWSPLPGLLGWDSLGDGAVFAPMASGPGGLPKAILSRDPAVVRADYRRSIEYSLGAVLSYVQTYGDDDLVLVLLGDHQPAPLVTGPDAGADVPVTVVARDPAVLDRVAGWGWGTGLRPAPGAPVWPMEEFRDRFLATFSRDTPR